MEENKNMLNQPDPLKVSGNASGDGLAGKLKKYLQAGAVEAGQPNSTSPAFPVNTGEDPFTEKLRSKLRGNQAVGNVQDQNQPKPVEGFTDTFVALTKNAGTNLVNSLWYTLSFADKAISKAVDTVVAPLVGEEDYEYGSANTQFFLNKIEQNKQALVETKNFLDSNTTGLEKTAIALGSSVDFLRSIASGVVSMGSIPIIEQAQSMYVEALDEKAKRTGKSAIELIRDNEDEELEPYLYGAISGVMEKVGIKQFDKYLQAVPKDKISAITKWLFASIKEGGTEYVQGMAEVMNRARAQGSDIPESLTQIYDYATSKDGAETFIVSSLGASVLGSPKLIKNIASKVKKEEPEAPKQPATKQEVKPKIQDALTTLEANVGTVSDPALNDELDGLVNQFSNLKEETAPEVVVETEDGLEESNIPVETKLTEEPGRVEAVAQDPVVQNKILKVKDKASLKDAIQHFYGLDKKAISAVDAAKINFQATVLDWVATNRAKKEGIAKEDWYKSRLAGVTRGELTQENIAGMKSKLNQAINDIVFHGGASVDLSKPIMRFGGVLHVGNMGTAREFRGFDPANVLNVFRTGESKGLEIQDFGTDLHTEQIISSTESDSGKSFLDFAKSKGLSAETAQKIQANSKLSADDVESIYQSFKDSGVNKFSRSEVLGQAVASQFARENGIDYFYYKNTAEAGKAPDGQTMVEEAVDGETSRSSLTEADTQGMPIDRDNISFAIVNPAILQKLGETETDSFEGQKQFLESIGEDTTRILYQDQEGDSSPRAQVAFLEDGRAIISAVTAPDVTSFIHEFSHVLRRDLTDVENQALEKAFGLSLDGNWDVAAEEKFAKAFERYVADGKLPDNIPGQFKDQVKAAFDKLAEWFRAIHESIKGQYNVDAISPEIRSVLDAIVTGKGLEVNAQTTTEGTVKTNVSADTGAAKESRGAGKTTEKPKVKEDATDKKQKQQSVREEPKKGAEKRKEEKPSVSDSVQRTEEKPKEKVKKNVSKPKTEKATGEVSQASDKADEAKGISSEEAGRAEVKPSPISKPAVQKFPGFSQKEIAKIKSDVGPDVEVLPAGESIVSITPLEGNVQYFDKVSGKYYDSLEDIPNPDAQKKIEKIQKVSSMKNPSVDNVNSFVTQFSQLDGDKMSAPQKVEAGKSLIAMAHSLVNNFSTSNFSKKTNYFSSVKSKIEAIINDPDSFLSDQEISEVYDILEVGESNIQEREAAVEKQKISSEKRAEEKAEKQGIDTSKYKQAKEAATKSLEKAKTNTASFLKKLIGTRAKIAIIEKNLASHRVEMPDGTSKLRFGQGAFYKDLDAYKAAKQSLEKLQQGLEEVNKEKSDIIKALTKAYYENIKQEAIYAAAVSKSDIGLFIGKQKISDKKYKEMAKAFYRKKAIDATTMDVSELITFAKTKPVPSFSSETDKAKKAQPSVVVNAANAEDVSQAAANSVSFMSRMIDLVSVKLKELDNLMSKGITEGSQFDELSNYISEKYKNIQERADSARSSFEGLNKFRKATYVPAKVNINDSTSIDTIKSIEKEYIKAAKSIPTNILNQPASRVNVNSASQRAALVDSVRKIVEGKFSNKAQYDAIIKTINEKLKQSGIAKLTKEEIESILKNTEAGISATIEGIIRKEGKDRPTQEIIEVLNSLNASPADRLVAAQKLDDLLEEQTNGQALNDQELLQLLTLPLVGIKNATLEEKKAAIEAARNYAKWNKKAVNNARAAARDKELSISDEMFVESIIGVRPDSNGVYEITVGRKTYRFTIFNSESSYDPGDFVYRNGIIYEANKGVDAGGVFSRSDFDSAGAVNLSMTKIEYLEARKAGNIFQRFFTGMQEAGLVFDGLYSFLDKLSIADKESQSMMSKLVTNTKKGIAKARIQYTTNTANDIDKIITGIGNVIGEKDIKKIYQKIGELRSDVVNITFLDDNGAPVTIRKTKATLLSDYVRMKDPNAAATYEAMKKNKGNDVATDKGWSDNKAAAIAAAIDPEMKAIGDFVVRDGLSDIFSRLNSTYRTHFGVDLVREENYFPWKRHVDKSQEASNYFLLDKDSDAGSVIKAVTNKNTISRTNSTAPFKDSDFFEDLFNYIDNANYYSSFLGPLRLLSNVLQSKENASYIASKFGKKYSEVGQRLFANIAANRAVGFQSNKALSFLRQGVVVGSLGGNLSLIPKQLISMPAYANALPTGQWAANMATLPWRLVNGNAMETYRMMYNTSFIKNRFRVATAQGANPDLIESSFGSIEKAIDQYKNKGRLGRELATAKLINLLMLPTRFGDFGSVMIGGEPIFRTTYDRVLSETGSKEKALEEAELALMDATSQTQQSDFIEDRPLVQTRSSFESLITTFMSTPILYGRMVSGAVRDLVQGKGSQRVALQKVVLFTYILPSLFYAVSSGSLGYIFGDDEDERFDDDTIKRNVFTALMGLIQHVPIVYPAVQSFLDGALFDNNFRTSLVPALGRAEKFIERVRGIAGKAIDKEAISEEDFIKLSKEGLSMIGLNVKSAENMYENWGDLMDDNNDYDPMTQLYLGLGYSKEALGLRKYGEKGKPVKIGLDSTRRRPQRRRPARRREAARRTRD